MRRRRFLRLAALAAGGAAAGAAAYRGFWATPRDLRILAPSFPVSGLAAPFRILLFSDVDYPRSPWNWSRIPGVAEGFAPDLVAVAGDLLDRRGTASDPVAVRTAARWLRAIPSRLGVALAPGEAESDAFPSTGSIWREEGIDAGPNDELERGPIDLFVADRRRDPAPWRLARGRGRGVATVISRAASTFVEAEIPGARRPGYEATFAFRLDRTFGSLDFRFDGAFRLVCSEEGRSIRLRSTGIPRGRLAGRNDSGFFPPAAVFCRGRVRIERSGGSARVRARFWPEAGEEPRLWTIDAEDRAPDRPFSGKISFGGRRGAKAIADVRVRSLGGDLLLAEDFDDDDAFSRRWRQPSRLRSWTRVPVPERPRILLSHHPDVVLDLLDCGGRTPDLVLAGHTHGGQVAIPGLGPILTDTRLGRRYDRGSFTIEGIRLFVTAGVGTSILPFRLGAPPDVACVTLVPC